MLTPLISRKLERRFDLLDVTGDGHIDEDDYRVMIARLLEATATAADSAEGRELERALLAWWSGLREAADTDGDGRIDRTEYFSAVERGVIGQPDTFRRLGQPVCQALVAIADSDRDARLTRSEFVALMSGFGVREAESVRAFDAMDSDGDGLVTSQEFEQATEEFFTSDDPSSVGNALWGAM